ncbi:sugar ABC transporter permease [Marispirochaeta sp.]|uniref:carbohydrate ABC transporter permease n=1 Tax=Marispirochaeta sp. TaxID=2038653 RepID=UPI0029C7F06D|nr:sugar ABC transporter permease [Marispirochaeta sp.]
MNSVLSSKKYIIFFVGPAFILFLLFGLVPIVFNITLSFFKTNLMSPPVFVCFRNFTNLFNDPIFIRSLKNNLMMVAGSLLAHLPLALFLGTIIFHKIKGAKFFQSVFFLPSVIMGAAIGLTWSFIYNSEFGIVNSILKLLNLTQFTRGWLSEESTVIMAIIVVVMWQYVGYHMVIQIAAMRNIPGSLYEAAAIDGATKWDQFRLITFPLIRRILKIDAVLIITGSLKYFDLIFVMTGGGPNHASEVLSTYMFYQGFRTIKYGYASTIGTILLLLCILAIAFSNIIFKSEKYEF